jgi:hypothetical protein
MGGLFKNTHSKAKGIAKEMQNVLIKNGGFWFDSYDGYLTKIYKKNGFVCVASLPFNSEFAPVGWMQNETLKNYPNVLFFVHKSKIKESFKGSVLVDNWDDGQNICLSFKNN